MRIWWTCSRVVEIHVLLVPYRWSSSYYVQPYLKKWMQFCRQLFFMSFNMGLKRSSNEDAVGSFKGDLHWIPLMSVQQQNNKCINIVLVNIPDFKFLEGSHLLRNPDTSWGWVKSGTAWKGIFPPGHKHRDTICVPQVPRKQLWSPWSCLWAV